MKPFNLDEYLKNNEVKIAYIHVEETTKTLLSKVVMLDLSLKQCLKMNYLKL